MRRAYRYVLERDVDEAGLGSYLARLMAGLAPMTVLEELFGSDERKAKPTRALPLPGDASFPFSLP